MDTQNVQAEAMYIILQATSHSQVSLLIDYAMIH